MNKNTFELVEFDGEIDEMFGDDYVEVPSELRDEVSKPNVNLNGKTPLSVWAKDVKAVNRKEKRAEAKRIRKMFK